MKDFIGLLLRVFIPIIGLILIFLPLWYVGWQVKHKTWWHYIGAVVGAWVILVVVQLIIYFIDAWVQNNIYDSHAILDGLDGNLYLIILFLFLLPLSSFVYIKKMYKNLGIKNMLIGLVVATILYTIHLFAFAYYIAIGLGQAGAKYF